MGCFMAISVCPIGILVLLLPFIPGSKYLHHAKNVISITEKGGKYGYVRLISLGGKSFHPNFIFLQ